MSTEAKGDAEAAHEPVGRDRLVRWARGLWRFRLVRVRGHSMAPALSSGDWLCVDTWSRRPQPGELVVVRDPQRPGHLLVKRVRSVGQASFAVGSDDPTSGRDSRHFGSLSASHLLGKVTGRMSTTGLRSLY